MSRELLCKKCAIQAHFSFNQEPAATRYAVLAAGSALNEHQASPGFLQSKLTPFIVPRVSARSQGRSALRSQRVRFVPLPLPPWRFFRSF